MFLSENLVTLRNKKHLSQEGVAKAVGFNLKTYQRYERGEREPQISAVVTLAEFYGITIDELVLKKI